MDDECVLEMRHGLKGARAVSGQVYPLGNSYTWLLREATLDVPDFPFWHSVFAAMGGGFPIWA
jgi:hypothetical protein